MCYCDFAIATVLFCHFLSNVPPLVQCLFWNNYLFSWVGSKGIEDQCKSMEQLFWSLFVKFWQWQEFSKCYVTWTLLNVWTIRIVNLGVFLNYWYSFWLKGGSGSEALWLDWCNQGSNKTELLLVSFQFNHGWCENGNTDSRSGLARCRPTKCKIQHVTYPMISIIAMCMVWLICFINVSCSKTKTESKMFERDINRFIWYKILEDRI